MASLYKKPIVVTDPKTGKKIKKKSTKWWGRYRDAMGQDRRVPLAKDKQAAEGMLQELVKRTEREMAGLHDPLDDHQKLPLDVHCKAFTIHLEEKGDCGQHIGETLARVRKIISRQKWKALQDITASGMEAYLSHLRKEGRGAETCNHYLRAMKQFCRWLVKDRRARHDPLSHLSPRNADLDRRRKRRPLATEEFELLVASAKAGKKIQGVSGADRAMLYVLAAWTGYRRGELASLTPESFALDTSPPTATVLAAYSKRRRTDVQPLHASVVQLLRAWLATEKREPNEILFPITSKTENGSDRRTSIMMRRDLAAARKIWLESSPKPIERAKREKSDFLAYKDSAGRYADFHSNRHLFISSLARAGVSPKTAQALARHSDIRLTMNVYTHVSMESEAAAIASLPAPPSSKEPEERKRA